MTGVLGGGLAIAATLLAYYGTDPDGLALAVRMTARWSFLFFWLSYAGGALATVFGPGFSALARRARPLGLAFASALMVHIGLVVWLGVAIGQIPLQGGLLWFFLLALVFTVVVALLSFGIGTRALGRWWRPLLVVATTYILISFGLDFVQGAAGMTGQGWLYAAEYLPFAVLSLVAIPLRLAAHVRQRPHQRAAGPADELDREPAIWR
jgi:hypothetical protein